MLAVRVILAAVVLTLWWSTGTPHGDFVTWLGWSVGWPAVTALTLLPVRSHGRAARAAPTATRSVLTQGRATRAGLTATLLGDGLLLGAAGWAMGGVSVLIVLHAVAVTLLVSYRTGVRLAFWHGFVAMLLLDAVALRLLPDTGSWTWGESWPFFAVLWAAVLSTATYVARAEKRKLRRLATAGPAALAEFGLTELSGRRAAVVTYGEGPAAVIGHDGVTRTVRTGPLSEPGDSSAVRLAREPGFLLRRRLDDRTDLWLASALPGARNVVVVPFTADHLMGALVVEVRGRRVERRAVENVRWAVRQISSAPLAVAG